MRISLLTGMLVSGVMLTAGCASKPSITEFQCRAGDWQTVGVRDGAGGMPSTQLLQHQEACGAYGIVPDRQTYLAGWQQGVAQYCTTDNGFMIGQRGGRQSSVCSDDEFLDAYAAGRELYLARQDVRRLENQLSYNENRIVDIKQEIIGASTAHLAPDLTARERIALVAKVEALVEERAELKRSLPVLLDELESSRQHLTRLQQTVAYAG